MLLALAVQVTLEPDGMLLELVDLGKHSLAVEAPLDLVRLECIAVACNHLELVAQASKFRGSAGQLGLQSAGLPLGPLDGLPSPVAVCRGCITIRRGLVALLPRRVQLPLELRQALALRGDGFLVMGELGAERLRHRFEARQELPPLGNGVAERAGEVGRVRHAPITIFCAVSLTSRESRVRLGGGDLGGSLLGEDFVAERHAEVANIDIGRPGHEADVSLFLAAKRAPAHRTVHVPDYLRAFP